MAQTENSLTFKLCDAGLGTTASTTDWGPFGVSVAVSGGERATSAQHTRDGDTPIVSAGKRGPITVTVRYVYTPDASELDDIACDIYESEDPSAYFCWAPQNDESGSNILYETSGGQMTGYKYPQGETGSADVILGEFQIVCAYVNRTTVGA